MRLGQGKKGLAVVLAAAAALALGGCGDTLQSKPAHESDIAHAASEPGFPVFWLGRTFDGMLIASVGRDPGGAYAITYGNCVSGGQVTCVAPLEIVTSPDNSFLPGGSRGRVRVPIRGRLAALAAGGRTIELATGSVVIDVFAQSAALARLAASLMDPINQPGAPGAPLPPALPDTHFDEVPIGEPPSPPELPSPGPSSPISRASGGPTFEPTPAGANGSVGR